MPANVTFEEHHKLLLKLAHQVHRRAFAAGAASVQFEDVFQEICIAWCQARDAWEPEYNVPFVAFLVRGARNHINRWVGKEIIESTARLELDSSSPEIDTELHEVVADNKAVSADDIVAEQDERRHQRMILSDDALMFVKLLEDPPPHLYAVIEGMKARREYAVSRGKIVGGALKKVNATLVFDLMGCNAQARKKILDEVRAYANVELLVNG